MNYYDERAQQFVARTLHLDLSESRQWFLERLPAAGRVLDAGCGSGRDAKAFLDAGFRVSAFDASREMARAASAHTGLEVAQCSFLEFHAQQPFDGIWACASLLHVPRADLPATLRHLLSLLHPGGLLYASFKLGESERQEGERYFNDATPESFALTLQQVPGAQLEDVRLTQGTQNPELRWFDALVRRAGSQQG